MPEPATSAEAVLIHSARQLLTLNGPAGPRRGPAMHDIGVIADGAVLIRGGVIEDVGPTRRVANLVRAKKAREIDATGRVVMPAFVDPDAPLISTALSPARSAKAAANAVEADSPRAISRRRMEIRADAMAHALASYGVLVAGARTAGADSPENVLRMLRVHKAMQASPLRIRSVLAWGSAVRAAQDGDPAGVAGWLGAIRSGDLASIVEFDADAAGLECIRPAARLAIQRGFAVRFRNRRPIDPDLLDVVLGAGAIAVHGPPACLHSLPGALVDLNGVFVIECSALVDYDPEDAGVPRATLDSGLALAISSAFRTGAAASFNMQFNLHLACSRLKLTPEQAITAATHNAAFALRMGDSAGSLAPARRADLLIMDVPDYRDLILRAGHHDVMMVMRSGRVIYRRPSLMVD